MKFVELRMLILKRFGRFANFADAIGTSRQYISAKLCGSKPLTNRDIELWARLLGIRKEDYGRFFFEDAA